MGTRKLSIGFFSMEGGPKPPEKEASSFERIHKSVNPDSTQFIRFVLCTIAAIKSKSRC